MIRAALVLFLLHLFALPAFAQQEFEPTADERKKIADCLADNAGESELVQMSSCIGLVADPCSDAPGANTFTIVACNAREQKIWDERLNEWYGEAQAKLKDDATASAALKEAQRDWIAFRDAKCGYWEKRYAEGTFASVAAGNCVRIATGQRALEMRAIFDDLDH